MSYLIFPHKNTKWHYRFMDSAKFYSSWSKDPSTKVGAVLVRDRNVLIQSYNGFPKNIDDTEERLNDRSLKYPLTIHAELNVIIKAAKYGIQLDDSDLYVYGLPICDECAPKIIQAGIRTIYEPYYKEVPEVWYNKNLKKEKLFREAGVAIRKLVDYENFSSIHFS